MQSKIMFFSILVVILSMNISCGDKLGDNLRDKHIVPYVPVYTEIPLNIGGESNNWANQPKYFNASSDGKALGYNGHGIIIFTKDNEEYKCYDATCTRCTDLASGFGQKDLETWIATCPVCGTEFLLDYGTPADSKLEIYPLREYAIQKRGNKLIVSN